jgi:large subunit ribosomal protein L24
MQNKYHVKKGDTVTVISGSWKGSDAKIQAVLKKNDRVVLEMQNLSAEKRKKIGMKTVKKSQQNPNGGMIERPVSVHVSNVKLKA